MRPYASTDRADVVRWYAARGQIAPGADTLPRIGLIEPGVAAGWVYLTDSRLALLENYITNPAASATERNLALDEITGTLIAEAKAAGRTKIYALTTNESIAVRAMQHGMHDAGTFRVLELEV